MSGGERAREIIRLYDEWADTYDTGPNRTRDLCGAVLGSELPDFAGADVVELGCGTGRNTVRFAERASHVVAVDFSGGMLAAARGRVSGGRVDFLEHDIRVPLGLPSAAADLVVIALVLEHVPDVAAVLIDCARILRPGGASFVCELHPCRQRAGARAQFRDAATGETVKIPAHAHEVSDYVNAGLDAGLVLARMGEWRDEQDRASAAPPRLLSLLFRRET